MEVKKREARSWLSAVTGPAVAAAFGVRLAKRLKGESGLFVTLTYDRENWANAFELYRASAEDRHVRLFIRRLSEYLGESLTARWACKMEFQREGWVHWHLIVLGVKRIPHEHLTDLWGMGHVWIDKLKKKRVAYFAKYVAKPGQGVPAFLLGERRGSVKVVRVSPGFWGDSVERREHADEPRERVRYPWCISVGDMLEDRGQVQVRFATGRFAGLKTDFFQFLMIVRAWGGRLSEGSGLHLTNARNPHNWDPSGWVWEFLRWRCEDEWSSVWKGIASPSIIPRLRQLAPAPRL